MVGGEEPAAFVTRAALISLRQQLEAGLLADELRACGGKMFGTLSAVDSAGVVHELHAFSGTLSGQWLQPGFVPPMFDPAARAAVEVPGERAVSALTEKCDALEHVALTLRASYETALGEMRLRHEQNRQARKAQRAQSGPSHSLDQESRRDKAERRRLDEAPVLAAERRLRAARRLRRHVSARLMRLIQDTYYVPLHALFAPHAPPAGAGDCAGSKLVAHAVAQGLTPLTLTEFFWGVGSREHGASYPPCSQKCGPILSHLWPKPEKSFALRILYEDDAIIAIDKPAGVLSVPGKHSARSVLTELQSRYPHALLAHRLDQDTSGVLLAGKDADSYKHLQRQFAARAIDKRYVALIHGAPPAEAGAITLPLRPNLNDRPRQMHDPKHGRDAHTEWQVLDRKGDHTRLLLHPLTGRTHQLRVHLAVGLGAPIVGDRLYGTPGERLMLHAEQLCFIHPRTGLRQSLRSPAPF